MRAMPYLVGAPHGRDALPIKHRAHGALLRAAEVSADKSSPGAGSDM